MIMAAKNGPKTTQAAQKKPGTRNSKEKKPALKQNSRTAGKTAGQSGKKGSAKKSPQERDAVMDEVYLMITLVVSVLLILSYINLCGPVGRFLNTIVFGMMGLLAYLFPFALFLGIAFGLSNRGNHVAVRRLCAGIGMLFVLTSLIQMLTGYETTVSIIGYFKQCAAKKNGGGLLGSLLLKILYSSFGAVATAVILIALLAICIMLLTGKTFFATFRQMGAQTAERLRRERLEQEAEEDEEYDEYDDESEETYERRPARIVTLKQEPEEEDFAEEILTARKKGSAEKITFLDSLKEKGNKKKKNEKSEQKAEESQNEVIIPAPEIKTTEMKEIIPSGVSELNITGDFRRSEQLAQEVNAIYEEELKRKFGSGSMEKELETGVYGMGTVLSEPEQTTGMTLEQPAMIQEKAVLNNDREEVKPLVSALPVDELFPEQPAIQVSIPKNPIRDEEQSWNMESDSLIAETERTVEEPELVFQELEPLAQVEIPDPGKNYEDAKMQPASVQELARAQSSSQGQSAPVQELARAQSSSQGQPQPVSDTEVTEIVCEPQERPYVFPPIALLSEPEENAKGMTEQALKETAAKLQSTLESFGVRVTVTNVSCGPAVTRYELQPEQGVKVSKITSLSDDIKLNLAASDIRIEAPISGKAAVGIEVPNKETSAVLLRELLDHKEFKEHKSNIAFAVGKDISGQAVVTDIGKMPHLLIAGATGSGKSVCINTLIMSILYKAKPEDVRLIMVDPKVVELSIYNGVPHLLIPVVTDPKKASAALNWAVTEMTDRYNKFAELGVRDLKGYNEKVAEIEELQDPNYQKLPQIVIIVDELADLMMVASNEVETAICRLAQMARAAGLHLIIATQRPSVNVITGVIKANIPSRIAFAVSSSVDSRTIIDSSGAESLLGKGDMLFFPSGIPKPIRVQGAFVSDKEVSAVVDFLKEQNSGISYNDKVSEHIANASSDSSDLGAAPSGNDRDDYFVEAGKFIIEKDKASIGMLQRVYKIGFNRAARIMDQLAEAGVVGPEEGTKPRKILMTMEEFEQYVEEYY